MLLEGIIGIVVVFINAILMIVLAGTHRNRLWLALHAGCSFFIGMLIVSLIRNEASWRNQVFICIGISFLVSAIFSGTANFGYNSVKYLVQTSRIGIKWLRDSILTVGSFWLFNIEVFAGIYFGLIKLFPNSLLSGEKPLSEAENLWLQFVDCLYYSVITITTLGYGDIHANPDVQGISIKFASIAQVSSGVFWLTMYLTILLGATVDGSFSDR
ncbi:hypothetical protein HYR99_10900 [Candidatus Poribacteria bacterium]|nr:hypothetical protein [Candidatus Poribacteria bacterium]